MSVKDSQAEHLLALLRGQGDVDKKIAEFNSIKAQVKHQTVQPEAIGPLFDACRIGVPSPNATLSAQALSCLGHLIKRVSLQDPSRIRPQGHHILPILVDKLGDPKERNRLVALQSLLELYKNIPAETEKAIKELGFVSKNARVREESLRWLEKIHSSQQGFSFRSYTPFLMKTLEDSSEDVREMAKNVAVELFRNAPDHAKADVKKELIKRQVRKGIADYIVSQLGIPGGAVGSSAPTHDEDAASSRHGKSVGGSLPASMASSAFLASLPNSEMDEMEPAYVNTSRELEETFHNMLEAFDGKESEHNWLAREKNITKLRQLARGNAYSSSQVAFQAGIRSLLDGIFKVVNSLRTTVATNGCSLVKDLAIIMGPGMDPMVEIFLSNMVKLCAGTKKITSQMGNVCVAVILANVSYHPKVLLHVLGASQDKNVAPRSYAAGWINIILETHADHKGQIEHSGGVDTIEKCIKRGLADANPGVREGMRVTYWRFAAIWPARGEGIMESLADSHRKLLEKANPNSSPGLSKSTGRGPAPSRSNTAPATRPSIREQILAQKRSKANLRDAVVPAPAAPVRPASPPVPSGPGGLNSAPVRRNVRPKVAAERPERVYSDPNALERGTPYTSRSNGAHSPPQSPPVQRLRGATQTRSPTSHGPRKLTVLEQLNHSDWKIRVEGIVTVACILAKRTPPGYEGLKMPTLPPSDVFAPTLAKLLNDPQPEVVEHVVAPEVLAELAKVVPMDQIVPKVLLLSEGDDEQHAQPINQATMPALKRLMSESEAVDLLFRIITSMGGAGIVPRKLALGSFTTVQKRNIIHGCLIWMNEIVESHAHGSPNDFLFNDNNYKSLVNRLIAMMNTTRNPNQAVLAALLKSLDKLDPVTFDKILSTFEAQIIGGLRRAWGVSVDDDADAVVVEEKVADVEQVLGAVPRIETSSRPTSRRQHKPSIHDILDGSPTALQAEDLTLVNIPPAPRPKTPPLLSVTDQDSLRNLPALPSSPDRGSDLLPEIASRRSDEKPPINVYQDPERVVESNGAVALSKPVDMNALGGNEWHRPKLRKQLSAVNLPKTPEGAGRMLITLIERLQTRDIDTQAFRKLTAIARENPVRAVLQEQNGDDLYDIWQGGEVFEELLTSLLEYLTADDIVSDRAGDLRVQGLLVLKQLILKVAPYFTHREPDILPTLMAVRGRYPNQAHITSGIEDISEEYIPLADPKSGIDAVLDFLLRENASTRPPTASWCMGLSILAAFVRASKMSSLEPQLMRLGELAVNSLNDEDSEVRRSCVAMCIEMHSRLRDDERLFDEILKGMKSGHQNLLAYYFAKRGGERQ